MDLNSITVSDFKTLFPRDFPYLPVWDNTAFYNIGELVYYTNTRLFYTATTNGTTALPTDTAHWSLTGGYFVDDFVGDADITKAFTEAQANLNQALYSSDAIIKLNYLYLTAHYLVNDLKAALGGMNAGVAYPVASRSVGSVSESYQIPDIYKTNPTLAFYNTTPYGAKFLSMTIPLMVGNVVGVIGQVWP